MAQKKITELQLKSSIVGDESLPVDNGIQTYRATPSQLYDYIRSRIPSESYEIGNLTIVPSVGSSALTIDIKNKAGNNASSTDPIRVGFRHATLTNGGFQLRELTGALTLVISSGSTLGQVSGQPSRIWVYLIDNAGTIELAVSHKKYRDDEIVSTTAEGGAGAADSATVMYSTTARSSVACRCIGYIDNTQTTAGTWASAGSQVQVVPFMPKRPTVQVFTSGTSQTYYTPAGCTAIRVRCVGGGGGGRGTNGAGASDGGAGTASTFTDGTISLSAGAGSGGTTQNSSSGVSSATGGDINLPGGPNGVSIPSSGFGGGMGGASPFSGTPTPGSVGSGMTGQGYGSGGSSGASTSGTTYGGGTGGAYCEKWIDNPAASFTYTVGAAGAAGGGATWAGGAGKGGIIIVEEFYY